MSIEAGDVVWNITGTTKGLNQALTDSERMAKESYGRIAQITSTAMIGVGAAITGAFAIGVKNAMNWSAAWANVATLGVRDMKALQDGVSKLATIYGTDLTESVDSVYQALSKQIPEGAVINVLESATRGAMAGVGSLTDAVNLGTSVMNAYGLNTGDAATVTENFNRVMGICATAVADGGTKLSEMGSVMGRIAPIAAAAKVPLEQLFASVAALTSQGIETSEAVSGLKIMLQSILKPGSDAAKIAERMGIDFNAAALATQGLGGFLQTTTQAVREHLAAGENEITVLASLFGSVEALNAVLSLTSEQGGTNFTKALNDMGESTQRLQDMSEAYIKSNPGIAFNAFANEAKLLSIEMGKSLIPLLREMMDFSKPILEWFTALPPWVHQAAFAFGALSLGLGGIMKLSVPFIAFLRLIGVLGGTSAASVAAMGPAGTVAAAGVAAAGTASVAATPGIAGVGIAATGAATGLGLLAIAGPAAATGLGGTLLLTGPLAVGVGAAAVSGGLLAGALLAITFGANYAAGKVGEYFSATQAASEANSRAIDGLRALADGLDQAGIKYDHAKVATLSTGDAVQYLHGIYMAHRQAVIDVAQTTRAASQDMAASVTGATDLIGQAMQREIESQERGFRGLAVTVEDVYNGMTWQIMRNATLATDSVVTAAKEAAQSVQNLSALASQYAWNAEQRRGGGGGGGGSGGWGGYYQTGMLPGVDYGMGGGGVNWWGDNMFGGGAPVGSSPYPWGDEWPGIPGLQDLAGQADAWRRAAHPGWYAALDEKRLRDAGATVQPLPMPVPQPLPAVPAGGYEAGPTLASRAGVPNVTVNLNLTGDVNLRTIEDIRATGQALADTVRSALSARGYRI